MLRSGGKRLKFAKDLRLTGVKDIVPERDAEMLEP
jgi:hypothetical protein